MSIISELKRRGKTDKVPIKFDIAMLNTLIKYMMSAKITKVNIGNMYSLFKLVDMDIYTYSQQIYDRVLLIKLMSEARVNMETKDPQTIRSYVLNADANLKDICDQFSWEEPKITGSEIRYISTNIAERLQYIYIFQVKTNIIDKLNKMDISEFVSYTEIANDLKKELSQLLVKLQNTAINQGMIEKFSFSDENFVETLDLILTKSKAPCAILQTGIRQMNAILNPGFWSGRIYVFLGLTGKFKSGTLLNLADQIRRFNPQIIPVEDGIRKTILFITMENSIEETIERLVDMYSGPNDNMRDMTLEEIISLLKNDGKYIFTNTKGIDIDFRFYPNLSIKTSDVYSIIQDIEDNGKKVIGLVLDYLLKIDSAFPSNGDERIRLSYATKELKSLSQYFNIPVITAMQVNREGNSIIDAAMRENKQDLLKYIGAANIGNCWNIVEESDWMALVSIERQLSTGKLFLSCKRLKMRGKKDNTVSEYFNHPFVDEKEIRLETDVDKNEQVSIISLATDLESVNQEKLENAQARPNLENIKNKKKQRFLEATDVNTLLDDFKGAKLS
jgi:replicative DNA helicase